MGRKLDPSIRGVLSCLTLDHFSDDVVGRAFEALSVIIPSVPDSHQAMERSKGRILKEVRRRRIRWLIKRFLSGFAETRKAA